MNRFLEPLCSFLLNISTLLSSQVTEKEVYNKLFHQSKLLNTIVESTRDGIIVVNNKGIITHCNSAAQKLMKMDRLELTGCALDQLWPNSFFSPLMETGEGFFQREEILDKGSERFHLLVNAVPVKFNDKIEEVIISFEDIIEARHQAYQLTNSHYCVELDSKKKSGKGRQQQSN